MPERRTHDYVRNGLTTLFAAFDVATGEVISSLHRRHRAAEFKKFLIKVDKEVPTHLQIHLICDNYGTHKTPAIRTWLSKHPRLSYALHPDRLLMDQPGRAMVRLSGRPEDPPRRTQERPDPRSRHPRLVKDWNADPKPFIWTKTAEEILESLAQFCRRISGAGH
jgi:hypothetical protein